MSKCHTYHGPNEGRVPKVKYRSRDDAIAAIERLYAKKPGIIHAFSPYKCDHCGYWHFGKLSHLRSDEAKKRQREENLVGILIGVLRGTYPSPPRLHKRRIARKLGNIER